MSRTLAALSVVPLLTFTIGGCATAHHAAGKEGAMSTKNVHGHPVSLAPEILGLSKPAKIEVRSSSFQSGSAIPQQYSDFGEKISPPLSWTGVPGNAKSVVVMCEDPDPPVDPRPFIHWLLFNLPPDINELRTGVPGTPKLDGLGGALQGQNSRGSIGYFGPRPPANDPPHHYYFQVYALDRELALPFGAQRQQLLDAMKGHVLAFGELVGTFQAAKGGK